MLFNSVEFLFGFLPITLLGFFLIGRRNATWAAGWIAAASIFFYGWWDYRYIPLLAASIIGNFWIGKLIADAKEPRRRTYLVMGITSNLGLLAYYKYTNLFLSTAAQLVGRDFHPLAIILPIGISFFTFTQIAFLVDTYRGMVKEYRFVHYFLFVSYFPHLIAGPILHHKEMMPQFADSRIYRPAAENFSVGLTIFFVGLAKKVLIADALAVQANSLFDQPGSPSLLIAWAGVLTYAFQLYFDFSGYSDMAIGLSRLFGVQLPLNFNSPYKANNISDFWRRWHMTLSRFLRDYLYFPLGGNRRGEARRYANLMTTMLLGGLWHGAAWNFMMWGGLHGIYLIVHHGWARVAERFGWRHTSLSRRSLGAVLTFVSVCFAWVFFRASSMKDAAQITRGMVGMFGVGLPASIGNHLGSLRPLLEGLGLHFYAGGGAAFIQTWGWIGAAAAIVFLFPNMQQSTLRFQQLLKVDASASDLQGQFGRQLLWYPSRGWALLIALITIASLLSLNRPSAFIYYRF